MCLCGDDPDPSDPYGQTGRQWETSMLRSCCNNPCGCLLAIPLAPCCACYLRYQAINKDWSKYICCQGLYCRTCTECTDGCAHTCPCPCLCLEVIFCECLAISATRTYVQRERNIQTDPCDNRIIQFNNFCQCLSCICSLLAICINELADLASFLRLIADIVYCLTQACLQGQTHLELRRHPTAADYGNVISHQPK